MLTLATVIEEEKQQREQHLKKRPEYERILSRESKDYSDIARDVGE